MARVVLAGWVGTGTQADPFRPDIPAGSWSMWDLRADCTTANGAALVVLYDAAGPVSGVLLDLGDVSDLGRALPAVARAALTLRGGMTVTAGATVRDAIRQLMTSHPTGPRFNPGRGSGGRIGNVTVWDD